MPFDALPSRATLHPKPFHAHVSDQELDDFKQLLRLSKIGPKTFENQTTNVKDYVSWGITRSWLEGAKHTWETDYDWRKTEDRINSFPNYTVGIEDEEGGKKTTFDIHFIALYSQKADAVPLVLLHGWPGSFLEFLGTLDVLRGKYDEETLPFHVVVPSLPGYGYSSGPPLDRDFNTEGIARVIDKLMIGLGFDDGYITQGGDIGSFISRVLAVTSDACKAIHLNFCVGPQEPKDAPVSSLEAPEQKGVQRMKEFATLGNAYAREHGTRPATIGLVLSSSPLALLAWIGEKFLQWTDTSPDDQHILDSVSLYWFTDSFPRCIYPYRQYFGPNPQFFHADPNFYIKKPLGYSWHPEEVSPVPKSWVATTGNLVWSRSHDEGGHFAAMEKPKLFVQDLEDFVAEVWPTVK